MYRHPHIYVNPFYLWQHSYENGDPVYEAYGIGGTVPFYTKVMDEIMIGSLKIKQMEVDVGMLPKSHKGLLGLDVLKLRLSESTG
ncbi:hypothetical protein [Paenibacillus alginolyticus]|uniref:hypothetical protein n=1 Tax=Paenibacillus alginolyticus TaxID=59839 RepID=UPI001FE52D63|nr:hypothetical protein [Paenibacillus frigoriresistens]